MKFPWKSRKLFCDFTFSFEKICQFLHENLKVFTRKSKLANVPIKIARFFYKNYHIFPYKLADFILKNVKFSWKRWKLFQRFYNFLKKICRFLHENVTVFTGKSNSSNVPVKSVRFFYKKSSNFSVKIVKFSCIKWQIFFKKM